jgi:Membrane domain of glycerophosphoryl diester phosphodiesterase
MSQTPPLPPPPPPPGGPPAPPGSYPQWGAGPASPPWAASPPPAYGWPQPHQLPGSGRFRAQAVGELLDSAFTLYRRNLRLILAITLVVQLPLAVVSYVVYELTGVTSASARLQQLSANGSVITQQQLNGIWSSLVPFLVVVFTIGLLQAVVVQPIATAAMTRAVGDIYLDHPSSVGSAYGAVGRRIGAVVGVALIFFGVGIGILAVTSGLLIGAVFVFGPAGAALLVLLVPAAVVVAILVYTRWLFAAPIVMLERAGARAALRRSWHLVRGSTMRVFGITILVGIITGILSAIVGALLSVATQAGDDNVRLILNQLATLVVAVVIQPISFIVVVLLYYDLRIRREAFDIEMLAATI